MAKRIAIKKKGVKYHEQFSWLTDDEFKVVQKGGYFDALGVLHNREGCIRCTQMVKETGIRCKNFAVRGSNNCIIHGGILARAKAGKEQLYSVFLKDKKMKNVYDTLASQSSDEISGYQQELSLLRTLLGNYLVHFSDVPSIEAIKEVAAISREIRALLSECTKAEIKMGQLIDIGKVTIIVKSLANIVSRYVKDPEILKQIAQDFDSVRWPDALSTTPQSVEEPTVRQIPSKTS